MATTEEAPEGWRIHNPDWPSGDGPHLVPDEGVPTRKAVRFLLPVEAVAIVDQSALFKSPALLMDAVSFHELGMVLGRLFFDLKGMGLVARDSLDHRFIVRKAACP